MKRQDNNRLRELYILHDVNDIFQILEIHPRNDREAMFEEEKLWDAGFNLDDWDFGFACRDTLSYSRTDEEGNVYPAWYDDVNWLGYQIEKASDKYVHVYYKGWHFYTIPSD